MPEIMTKALLVLWLVVVVVAAWLVMRRGHEGFAGSQPVPAPDQFPYFVTFAFKPWSSRKKVQCTGVLVAPRTVLTSFHGLFNGRVHLYPAGKPGPNDLYKAVSMEIGTVNPEKHSFTMVYDDFLTGLVILRLSRPSQKRPIRLASSSLENGTAMTVLSRSYTESSLQMAPLKYVTKNEAFEILKNDPEASQEEKDFVTSPQFFNIPYSSLELAFGGPGTGACFSDIGAPILNGSTLAGMVFSAKACGKQRKRTYVHFSNMASLLKGPYSKQIKALIV